MTVALIDSDPIVYACGFASQHNKFHVFIKGEESMGAIQVFDKKKEMNEYLEEYNKEDTLVWENKIQLEPLSHCLNTVKQHIKKILEETGCLEHRLFLTGKGNFRDEVATIQIYKGNRLDTPKPIHYQAIRDYLVKFWGAEIVDGMEADDKLAIEQTKAYGNIDWNLPDISLEYANSIICTIDKDLLTVPGYNYNPRTEEKVWVTEVEAHRNFWKQMLTGDAVDNIPGLYKITGKKCSKKILEKIDELETEKEMWEYVLGTYMLCDGTKQKEEGISFIMVYSEKMIKQLTEIGRLLFMLREPLLEDKSNLWSPPK